MNKLSNIFAFFGMTILSLTIFSSVVAAQGFDVEAYLKRKDSNKNGKVEPEEMSSNTKSYIAKLGLDTSKPISISKVMSKVRKTESAKAKASRRSNTPTKVPGFGVESEGGSVDSFSFNSSATKTKGVSNAASTRYSDSVNRQVESTLEKYDRNKDGSLDKSEQERSRWGSPSPESSDLNKDGKLSRDELAKRYKAREDYYKTSRNSRDSSRDSSRDRGGWDRNRRTSSSDSKASSSRTSSRTSSRASSSRTSSTRSSSSKSSSTSSKSTAKTDRGKYLKYAQSLVESYDKDKDGKLSKEEIKAMRRPPVGADVNEDGFISETELVDSLSGANKSKTTSAKSGSKTASSSRSSKYRSSRGGTSSSRSRSSASFGSLDTNEDQQIQMHEFSKKWDDEIVAEFYEKDKNGDGIITSQEWSAKK